MDLSFQADGFFAVAADIALLALGLILIIKGGDVFVESAVGIARSLRVPEIVIGATIVSIGTTLPEIITSVTSVVKGIGAGDALLTQGYNSLAVGNAVGSMMCNTGLILGLVMTVRPPRAGSGFALKGIYLLCVSAALSVFSATNGAIELWEGIVLLGFFVVFVGLNLYEAAGAHSKTIEIPDGCVAARGKAGFRQVAFFLAGAAAIALGAMLLVDNAQSLCVGIGIPQQIVGITVVAIGTSLPELVTSLTSLKKGTADIGLGNIIGANVINATLLLGLISCISGDGLPIDAVTKNVAVWVMLAIAALLVVPAIATKKTYKWQGIVMLMLYLGFIVYNIVIIVI